MAGNGGRMTVPEQRTERGLKGEEARTGKPNSRWRLGSVLMGVLIIAIVAVALGANSWKRDLPVSGVRTLGNSIVPASEILKLAAIPKNARLFSVDLGAVQRRVRENPFLRSVSVNRQGPEGISIEVEERQPIALLVKEQLLYVDEEGVVLPVVKSELLFDLPVLTGALPDADCVPGKKISRESVREALHLLVLSRAISDELFRRISEVEVCENGDLLLHTADAGVPVVVGRGEIAMKLVKFDAFWRQIVERRGPQQLRLVDLRFEDRVIARWNDKSAGQ